MKRAILLLGLLGGPPFLAENARGQATATGDSGLYGTGFTTSGTQIADGTTSSSAAWSVTGDIANGVSASKFLGTAYVVTGSIVSNYGFVAEQSSGIWITAPGATEDAGSYPGNDSTKMNEGGIYLPGFGTSYQSDGKGGYYQEGVYVYTLTFNITGTGSAGQSVANFRLNLNAAADDTYSVYINPTESSGLPTGPVAYTSSSSYAAMTAQNITIGYDATKANYELGTNQLVFVVDNTANSSGPSNDNQTTGSGLLVYGLTAAVPEVWPWLPAAGAILAYAAIRWLRRRRLCNQSDFTLQKGLA